MAYNPNNPNGQATMANSAPVVLASDQSTLPTGGSVAHDAVDSGNPIKFGGKVSTSTPTAVANADRVDALFDEYGRQVISDRDVELGLTIGTTGLRDRLFVQRNTFLSDSLADGIAGFWTQVVANGGTIASTAGEGLLSTSTAVNGSAKITSPTVPYYPGQVAWLNSAVRFGDTGTAGNIRRLGMFTTSGDTPQEGFYFELSGTTLNAVTVKAGVATAVASTSWTRFAFDPFTLTTSYVSLEIRYTANTVWFYVNNILRHQVSGTTSALTTSLTLPITVQNVKTSGASDITFSVRNIGNGSFGERGGTVSETGLSAVEARAMGGGTPHDSVDSGNPLKVGGRARSTEITAAANNDRVDAIFDLVGKQIVLPYANPENFVSGAITTAMTATTSTSLVAAPGAGLRNYITTIIVSNAHATVGTDIVIQDGSGGTTLLTIPAAAVYGGAVINLPVPLRQPTANTAIFVANVTTGASTKASAVGYKGA